LNFASFWVTGWRGRLLIACVTLLAACTRPPGPEPVSLVTSPAGADTRVTLLATPGLKVNARLVPALELADGTVLRFGAGRRTADSAYFAEPPSALLPGRTAAVHGTLRASVCKEEERVCRTLALKI
jgi:hypothetical protein